MNYDSNLIGYVFKFTEINSKKFQSEFNKVNNKNEKEKEHDVKFNFNDFIPRLCAISNIVKILYWFISDSIDLKFWFE